MTEVAEPTLVAKWRLLHGALVDQRLSRADCATLWQLIEYTNGGRAWPSLGRLAKDTQRDRRTVVRSIGRLAAAGYIEVDHGGGIATPNGMTSAYIVKLDRTRGVNATSDTTATSGAAVQTLGAPVSPITPLENPLKKAATKPTGKTKKPTTTNNLPALEAFKLTPELRAGLSAECPGQANKLDLLAARFRDDEFWQRAFAAGRYADPAKTFGNFVRREEGFARDRGGRSPAGHSPLKIGTTNRDYTPEQRRAIYGE